MKQQKKKVTSMKSQTLVCIQNASGNEFLLPAGNYSGSAVNRIKSSRKDYPASGLRHGRIPFTQLKFTGDITTGKAPPGNSVVQEDLCSQSPVYTAQYQSVFVQFAKIIINKIKKSIRNFY